MYFFNDTYFYLKVKCFFIFLARILPRDAFLQCQKSIQKSTKLEGIPVAYAHSRYYSGSSLPPFLRNGILVVRSGVDSYGCVERGRIQFQLNSEFLVDFFIVGWLLTCCHCAASPRSTAGAESNDGGGEF